MKKLLTIALLALIAFSCDKDQKVVKQLDGTWKATSYVVTSDGVSEDYTTSGLVFTMEFNDCKLKKDEFCNLRITQQYGSDVDIQDLEYRVEGNGSSLELREVQYPAEASYIKILEHEKDKLELEFMYAPTYYTRISLTKE